MNTPLQPTDKSSRRIWPIVVGVLLFGALMALRHELSSLWARAAVAACAFIALYWGMRKSRNVWCLLALCLPCFSVAGCHADSARQNPAVQESNESLSVDLEAQGYLYRWHLKVDSSGNAEVTEGRGEAKTRSFQVSPNQLNALRQALAEEGFFELDEIYGDRVPDGGEKRLKITRGKKTKTVTLLFLGNWERNGHPKLAEAQRAQRIRALVEGWKPRGLSSPD
jgi:hypothetical protein